jgi:hypothetical protein
MIFGEDDATTPGSNPQGGQQQKVRFDVSQMQTIYANLFALAGSPDEITIYLGANSPLPPAREAVVPVSHRLMMLPSAAKRLMIALQQTIKAHEDRFGPIEIAPQRPPDRPRNNG